MLIYSKMPWSFSAEAYKSIRTSLQYISVDNPVKILAVTSSLPGEGKSTISGNLALSLAEVGNKVLLIDCDLRKPSIHRKFLCSNKYGLTDVLINMDLYKEAIYEFNPKVFILPAGHIPPNPCEILGSNTFDRFIDNIAKDFDYVIMDTPPVLAVSDAKVIAAKADATIIIVRQGKTKEKQLLKTYEELTAVKARVIGTILNACNKDSDKYYYRYDNSRGKRKRTKKIKRTSSEKISR